MNQEIEQLIVRVLSGEAGYEDMISFSDWLSADAQNKEIFLKVKKYWDAHVSHIRMDDSLQSYNRILKKMDIENKPRQERRIKPWLLAVAAILTGIIVLLSVWKTPNAVHEYSYITGSSVSEMILPDGTKVSLNKNSTLKYTSEYGTKIRNVDLRGEALFNVVPNRESPFVVNVNNTKVTALGTVFNVKDYPEDSHLLATLVEGSIRFETAMQSVLLKPDQQLIYHKQNEKIDVENVETDLVIAWKDRLIKYRSITFYELVRRLEKIYNVEIVVENRQLGEQIISGSFESHLLMEQIFDVLQKYLTFRWKQDGNVYTIYM